MTTKSCFKCGCEKPLDAFYAHPKMADGRLNKCKTCTLADVKRHRLENIGEIRAYDRVRAKTPDSTARRVAYTKMYRIDHPARYAANKAVRKAVKAGGLQPLPCLMCGSKAVAHHPDYSRPLDVVWLCQPHHRQAHLEAA